MSKTAYEIESELKGSAVDRTGFGGRPELINFYAESTSDLSALPVLDSLTIDALRCGKIIPVMTVRNPTILTMCMTVAFNEQGSVIVFGNGETAFIYTIATKTWAIDS